MKKIFTILCAAVIAASAVNAKVVMTESFKQDVGTLNIGQNTAMGSNMTDWWSYSGNSNYIKVEEGSLSYSGYKTSGEGNKAFLWSTGADDFRQFSPITSGKAYLGAIINVKQPKNGTISDYFLSFGDAGASNMYARLYSKTVKDGEGNILGYKLGIAKFSESNTYVRFGETVYAAETDYLVVLEYEFVDGEKNDIARLYVNPTKNTSKATLECVQDTVSGSGSAVGANAKNDASKLASVNLRQGTYTPSNVYIDEIKVTTAWADLWESGDAPVVETPTISTESSVAFGEVTTGVEAVKSVTVQGSYLTGAITVASSDEQVAVSATSISKEEAEAEGGYTLSLTLTAAAAGSGSTNITLSSEGASNQVISVSWTAVAPTPKVANIAALKTYTVGEPVILESEPVVVGFIEYNPVLQDESGAIIVQDLLEAGGYGYYMLAVGDKVSGLGSFRIGEEDYLRGFPTVTITGDVTVASKNNKLTPIAVSVADAMSYGPAYIQLTQVTFTDTEKTEFAAGWFNIAQGNATARIQVPAGCDIIGEAIPDKADIVGNVIYTTGGIAISASADVTNRVARTATGISTVKSQGKAVKTVRDGQIVILRDGKAFNVLGSEL